ncbi:MAG TPA: aspartate--tRNA ligase [bacterium]|nr:aspartate--tRNA ligase [bacterium]
MLRTYTCGQLNIKNLGEEVILCGWVNSFRDHGGITFIDLRDRYGITQILCSPEVLNKDIWEKIKEIREEWVIKIEGDVVKRPEETINPKIPTGEIEIKLKNLTILNKCKALPFEVSEYIEIGDNIRLKYRYIDLRRQKIKENLIKRSFFANNIRQFLVNDGFIEIETPVLTKSTPEGARDFIVPSRLNPGKFYALPQSPQLFKQILMIGGMDKYFQIARCFRDEDMRADRQPEFTQIDIEMSFIEEKDIMGITEKMLKHSIEKTFGIELKVPFPIITYEEAMSVYGTDKPDLKDEMKFFNLTEIFKGSGLKIFEKVIEEGGIIKGFFVKKGENISLKDIDNFTNFVKEKGCSGLGWIRFKKDEIQSPFKKFLSEEMLKKLKSIYPESENTLLFFLAGEKRNTEEMLFQLKENIKEKIDDKKKKCLDFVWVVDFPLFEYNSDEKRIQPVHHPFTSPRQDDISLLEKEPLKVKSLAYDLVLNGIEIGGGSIRIHKKDLQEKIFKIIGIEENIYNERFGFLLQALDFGAPPHGGIAFGIDRLIMILVGEESIRETIAFPKTQKGVCPLTQAPSDVDPQLLKENKIHIDIETDE